MAVDGPLVSTRSQGDLLNQRRRLRELSSSARRRLSAVASVSNGEGAVYTRRRRPVTLLWSASFESIAEAYAFEKQVQGWRRAKRMALVEERWEDLPELARGHWRGR